MLTPHPPPYSARVPNAMYAERAQPWAPSRSHVTTLIITRHPLPLVVAAVVALLVLACEARRCRLRPATPFPTGFIRVGEIPLRRCPAGVVKIRRARLTPLQAQRRGPGKRTAAHPATGPAFDLVGYQAVQEPAPAPAATARRAGQRP